MSLVNQKFFEANVFWKINDGEIIKKGIEKRDTFAKKLKPSFCAVIWVLSNKMVDKSQNYTKSKFGRFACLRVW